MKPKGQRLVLTLNSHSLSAYQTCQKKYLLSSSDNLVQVGHYAPFDTGTAIHLALFRMNRARIQRPSLTPNQNLTIGLRTLYRSQWYKKLKTEEQAFHASKLLQYVAWRSTKPWLKTIGAEVGFSKILYEDKNIVFIYEGRIDEIAAWEDDGQKFTSWIDYKTQSKEYKHYENRNQFLGYSWALGTNYGFIISYGLQKEKLEPFNYRSIYHSATLISQWRDDTIRTFREIINKIPFGEDEFRRNRSACDSGNFGLCSFVRLCDNATVDRSITDGIRRIHYKSEPWRSW